MICSISCANAGGFDRFDQDISLLFDNNAVVLDLQGSYVTATSHYSSVDGARERVPIVSDFVAGSLRLKFTLNEASACLVHLGQPFGTDVDHGFDWSRADIVVTQEFRVTEFGLTCSYRTRFGEGYLRGILGIAHDSIDFVQTASSRNFDGSRSVTKLTLKDSTTSWRAGLAYELPSSGLIARLVYFSPIEFDMHGNLTLPTANLGGVQPNLDVVAKAAIPEAVEVSLSAVISPGWLSVVTAKWVNWSELDHVFVRAGSNNGFVSAGTELADLHVGFRDGLTVSFLLGHAISPNLSAWTRLAWDRGVTTGTTEHTQSWSLFGGVKYKLSKTIELSTGLGLIWQDAGTVGDQTSSDSYVATFDDSLLVVPQLGMTIKY